jgi:Helicase conserved C-terminal domain/PLD-like domain
MTSPPHVSSNILTATTQPPLLDRLKQMLEQSVRADIAVGYLFLSGFHQVADEIDLQQKIRVLVGRTDRPTLEAVAAGLQQAEALQSKAETSGLVRKSDREQQAREATATIGQGVARLPQNDESEKDVARLREMIASGRLEIKTYPRGLLHAKAYLCWYPEDRDALGSAIVGSSNFTLAGFTGNTELNVRIQTDPEMTALREWFDGLWADAVDITDAVLVELNRSWPLAQTSPYHVYLKTLYELYHDELGLPPIEPPKRGVELANFQSDAVRHALGMLDRHGGCFIGDVVGLGKTYIGAEIVRQIQLTEPPGRHPLIICPAGLKPMWTGINELFGLGAAIVSMSALRPPAGIQFDEDADEYLEPEEEGQGINLLTEFPNRGVLLVDEVHNFRNAGTRRYAALSDYLWNGEHKVVLLSATPQNLGPRDIYHELRLFLDEVDHGISIEPLRLEDYFSAVQRWYEYEAELDAWKLEYEHWRLESQTPRTKRTPPPPQPEPPNVPFADISNVLNPVFIRRRRKDIKDLYGESATLHGKPVRFPKPSLENLEYRLDTVYARAFPFRELQDMLARHSGARYRALDFLSPAARNRPEYQDLRRARTRVATLTRFLLVKRLESSVAAFRSTIDVLARSNRHFREALTEGFVPIGTTATAVLSGHAFDTGDLLERLQFEEAKRKEHGQKRSTLVHSAADFDADRWTAELDADYEILSTILERLERITPDDDDKLQELKSFLDRPEVSAGKVLIFSEAEATIDYLYEQLNPKGRDPSIAKLSGSNHTHIQEIVKRFAPAANLRPRERMPGPAVRVLLATDVISEGQNLQDCNRVLNYDLHWNPVRLIQRFGRVDRIGTVHDTIYLHNTWPDVEMDAQLSLMDRLQHRIQAFHDMIGLDAPLLSDNERINPGNMYAIYSEKQLPGEEENDPLDDVSAHQRGINLLQQLERDNPDLWALVTNLPDGIRAALTLPAPSRDAALARFLDKARAGTWNVPLTTPEEEGGLPTPVDMPRAGETVVLLEHEGVSLAYAVDSELKPRRITPSQLVRTVACEADTPAQQLPRDTNRRVMAAYEQARIELAMQLGKDRKPVSDTRLRRYVTRQLRQLRDKHRGDEEELKRIGVLQQIFPDRAPPRVTAAIDEMRRLQVTGDSFLRRLEALRSMYRLNPSDDDDDGGTTEVGVLRIVCSDGLV